MGSREVWSVSEVVVKATYVVSGSSGSSGFFKLSVNPDVDDNKQNQVKNYFVNNS